MSLSRRVFLASSTACVVGGIASSAEAASASRSRLFVSDWPLTLIGRELVLGLGYMLITSPRAEDIIKGIGTGRVKTSLETFGGKLDEVDIEGLNVTVNGEAIREDRKQYFLAALKMVAQLHAAKPLELPDLGPAVDKFVPVVQAAVQKSTLEYSYRLRYKHVHVSTSTILRKGHLRKVVDLLCPVGQVMGLQFVTDAQERCGKTYITTSLWIDYCVGRREGPIVRRVAEREIGCREDALLSRLERVVYQVIHEGRNPEDLRKIVPDLIRRIETQEIG